MIFRMYTQSIYLSTYVFRPSNSHVVSVFKKPITMNLPFLQANAVPMFL